MRRSIRHVTTPAAHPRRSIATKRHAKNGVKTHHRKVVFGRHGERDTCGELAVNRCAHRSSKRALLRRLRAHAVEKKKDVTGSMRA